MPIIREELDQEAEAIRQLTDRAFAGARFSSGTEGAIVDALRRSGRLALSLVASEGGLPVGHVAFSPVRIGEGDDDGAAGWFALGPISVAPDRQRRGIGAALIREGLQRLRAQGAAGVVLLGEAAYYGRFGFAADPAVHYPDAPAEYLLTLPLNGPAARGIVCFDPAFNAR